MTTAPIHAFQDTWNDSGTLFYGIQLDVTDSASDAASKLLQLDVDGTTQFSVRKDGEVVANASVTANGFVSSGNIDAQGNQLILDADNDTYIVASTDDRLQIFVGGSEVIRLDANATDTFQLDGVGFSPTGAVVGQALGFPNSTSTVEPYTPAGGGNMLRAANETITGDHNHTGNLQKSGAPVSASVSSLTALTALASSEFEDGQAVYVDGEGWFVWDSSDLSNSTQTGTDGAVTAGDDQFTAASANFQAGVDEREQRGGTNPKVLEVEGAAFAGGLSRNTIFQVDSATSLIISSEDFGATGTGLTWTLHDADSPLYWDGGAVHGIYFPPDSDTSGANGAWARAEWIDDKSYVRPEWFYTSGDGDDYGPAFQRALDFLSRWKFSELENERVHKGLKLGGVPLYPVETGVHVHPSFAYLSIYAEGKDGAVVTTSTAGLDILTFGDDVSDGTDATYSRAIDHVNIENIVFRNTNNASTKANPTRALVMYQCVFSHVNNNFFDNFNISVDGWRCKFYGFHGNRFRAGGRAAGSTAALAFVRLQGISFASGAYSPGGGNHVTDNEMLGRSSDLSAVEAGWLIHTVDGQYMRGNHYNVMLDSIVISPENNSYNNTIAAVYCAQEYFDGKSTSGAGIRLAGTVGENTELYTQVWSDQCFYRTGQYGVVVDITEDATGSGFTGEITGIKVTGGEIGSMQDQGVRVFGASSSRADIEDITVDGVTFTGNNRDGNTVGHVLIEAKTATVNNNLFNACNTAPEVDIEVNTSEAATAERNLLLKSNNFSKSNYTDQPYRLTSDINLASTLIEGNLTAGMGEHIRQIYTAETINDGSAILFKRRLASSSCFARMSGWISGYSFAGVPGVRRRYTGTFDFSAYTEPDGTVQVLDGEGRQTAINRLITNNDVGAATILLTGDSWSSGVSVARADTFLDSGNVWMVIEDGTGTTGTSNPLTGNSGPGTVTDSNGVRYLFVTDTEQADAVAIVVSGGGTADFNWVAHVDWAIFENDATG